MSSLLAAMVALYLTVGVVTAQAQQCLHGATENDEQARRRREALAATRTVNNIQANQSGAARGLYLRYEELAGSPFASRMRESPNELTKRISLTPGTDILPGWKLTLDAGPLGYWFMIRDQIDPCHFAYISNQDGLIYSAEPIR